jgi:hypothetical protein
MLIDYINDCALARSLGILAQIKIMEESSLVFTGLWFDIYLRHLSENTRLCHKRRKNLKISKICYDLLLSL